MDAAKVRNIVKCHAEQCHDVILAVQPVAHHTLYRHVLHNAPTCKPGSVYKPEVMTLPCLKRSS